MDYKVPHGTFLYSCCIIGNTTTELDKVTAKLESMNMLYHKRGLTVCDPFDNKQSFLHNIIDNGNDNAFCITLQKEPLELSVLSFNHGQLAEPLKRYTVTDSRLNAKGYMNVIDLASLLNSSYILENVILIASEEKSKFIANLNEFIAKETILYHESLASFSEEIEAQLLNMKENLKEKYREMSPFLRMSDSDSWIPIKLGRYLGAGGSKTALPIEGSKKVLLLATYFPHHRYFSEELSRRRFYEFLGIPVLNVERGWIALSDLINSDVLQYPCLIADKFSTYVLDGSAYILDSKNFSRHIPPTGLKDIVFENESAANNIDVWIDMLRPLIKDIKCLADNGIIIWNDIRNFVVTKSMFHTHSPSEWEIRMFMFDMFHKTQILNFELPPVNWKDTLRVVLRDLITHLLTEPSPCVFSFPDDKEWLLNALYNKILLEF